MGWYSKHRAHRINAVLSVIAPSEKVPLKEIHRRLEEHGFLKGSMEFKYLMKERDAETGKIYWVRV